MHLGLDRVLICSALGQTIVPFAAIDTVLPQVVIDLYQKSQPDTIYVITGPWSFTNVRVGVLVVDILMMIAWSCRIMQTDKISLYKSLWMHHLLPASLLLYIGQRKNLWYYDFSQSDEHQVITHTLFSSLLPANHYAVDMMIDDETPFSFDAEKIISRWWWEEGPCVLYQGNNLPCASFFTPTEKLQPYYAMHANLA